MFVLLRYVFTRYLLLLVEFRSHIVECLLSFHLVGLSFKIDGLGRNSLCFVAFIDRLVRSFVIFRFVGGPLLLIMLDHGQFEVACLV